jgi:hypothetical protein
MASTRNKNTIGDYKLEQQRYFSKCSYLTNEHYGKQQQTMLPGDGLLSGKIAAENLSSNSCDIESKLWGIGSTNLVIPQPDVTAEVYRLKSLAVIDRLPLFVPEPLNIAKDQRPLFR